MKLISSAVLFAGLTAVASTGALAALEEVVVTTRKREENLQTVPVAVSAFSAELIEKRNISDLNDVVRLDSSVAFDQGFSAQDTRITIRGLAPTQGRQNVAVLEDGIDVSSQALQTNGGSMLVNPRLFDLERIEVVKGPQNALYGRSAFAGAINYVSREPSDVFEARVSTEIGTAGEMQFKGGLSGPLAGDTLLGSITAATWENDGFYKNAVTGNEVGGAEGYGVTGTLLWKPVSGLSIKGRISYSDDEYDVDPYVTIIPSTPLPIPPSAIAGDVISESVTTIPSVTGTIPDADSFPGATMSPNPRNGAEYDGTDSDVTRATLAINYDIGSVTLTSLTHWADADNDQFLDASRDGDYNSQFYAQEARFSDETSLFSQELRLQSNGNAKLNWTVGGLYWDEGLDFTDSQVVCVQTPTTTSPGAPCGPVIAAYGTTRDRYPDLWGRDTTHWSIYGLVDWAVMDKLNLIAEARYVSEESEYTGPDRTSGGPRPRAVDTRTGVVPGLGPVFFPNVLAPAFGSIEADADDDFISPKVTLQWSQTDDLMGYLSWAMAHKPKGIAIVGALAGFDPANNRFDTEEMQVWELGAKSRWLDGRLVLNGALFYQDYNDKQLSSQVVVNNLLATRPINAASAEVKGLELEVAFQATDYLSLRAAMTYLDTEYKDFLTLDSGAGNVAAAGACEVVTPTGVTRPTCQLDLSGNELEYAPEMAFVGNVAYRRPLRGGGTDWFLEGDVNYQDERFQRFYNTVKFDSYTTADFRAGIASDQWEVMAYIDNAFDDDTIKTAVNGAYLSGYAIVANPPTTNRTVVLPANLQAILPDERQVGLRLSYRFGGEK